MIDSQVHTEHLERFGARHIPRSTYLSVVHDLVGKSRIRQNGLLMTVFSFIDTVVMSATSL